MYRVGLTGGIATGKSRVLARLAERGLHTIDLDVVGHQVIEPGRPAHAEILAAFGETVRAADGTIDRRALGAIVFSDAAARRRLNAIVHPRVFEEEERVVATLDPRRSPVVVTDATLLVETGHHLRFPRLIATYCDRRQQIARIMHRDGLSAGAAQARLAAQMPAGEKARFAHDVIDSSGAPEDTDARARALAEDLHARAVAWSGPAPVSLAMAVGCLVRGPQEGPRGLTPVRLAAAIVATGWPPLPVLAEALLPPAPGPWYEAGALAVTRPGAEALMGPAVLWSLARYGADVEATAAAATSIARLVDSRPEGAAAAVAVALALFDVARAGAVSTGLATHVRAQVSLIERWTGQAPPEAVWAALERTAGGVVEAGTTSGALHGLATGVEPAQAPPPTLDAARSLARG